MRGGHTVPHMLFAGASAANTSSGCGDFTFDVSVSQLWPRWDVGSAFMLMAGAGPVDTSTFGGALTFGVFDLPSDPWWTVGSANKYFKYKNKKRSIPF